MRPPDDQINNNVGSNSHLEKLKEAMDHQLQKSSKIVGSFTNSQNSSVGSVHSPILESPTSLNRQHRNSFSFNNVSSPSLEDERLINFPRVNPNRLMTSKRPNELFKTSSMSSDCYSPQKSRESLNSLCHSPAPSVSSCGNALNNDNTSASHSLTDEQPFETDSSANLFKQLQEKRNRTIGNVYEMACLLVFKTGLMNFWKNIIDFFAQQFFSTQISVVEPRDLSDIYNTPWQLRCYYDGGSHYDPYSNPISVNDNLASSSYVTVVASDGSKGIIYKDPASLKHEGDLLIDSKVVQTVLERATLLVYTRKQQHIVKNTKVHDNDYFSSIPNVDDIRSIKNSWKVFHDEKLNELKKQVEISASAAQLNGLYPQKKRAFVSHFSQNRKPYSQSDISKAQSSSFSEEPSNIYDEYEQNLLSPWSRSPVASPSIQTDPNRNPFFQNCLQESSFATESSTEKSASESVSETAVNDDCKGMNFSGNRRQEDHLNDFTSFPTETAVSIVHVPLMFPCSDQTSSRGRAPIAILSFKSNLVPYPENLIASIERLIPFIFSSYSNSQSVPLLPCPTQRHLLFNTSSTDNTKELSMSASSENSDCPHKEGECVGSFCNINAKGSSLNNIPKLPRFVPVPSEFFKKNQRSWVTLKKHRLLARLKSRISKKNSKVNENLRFSLNDGENYSNETITLKKDEIVLDKSKSYACCTSESHKYVQGHCGGQAPPFPLLKVIIDSIPVHVFTADPGSGKLTWVNRKTLLYCGLNMNEQIELQFSRIHPDDLPNFLNDWKSSLFSGSGFYHEIRLQRFDNVYRYFICRAVPLRDCTGSVLHFFGTMTDVHDQKLAERELQKQSAIAANENSYRSLAEASPQIVFAANGKNGIIYANAQWLSYSGLSLESSLGLGFLSAVYHADRKKCLLPESLEGTFNNQDESNGTKTFAAEIRFRSTDGHYRWHLVKSVCVNNSADTSTNLWLGTCTDIHDHKMLEEKLQESNIEAQRIVRSKMQYLSNMSHEIRTPLIGITGMVSFLLETQMSAEQLSYARIIQQSAKSLLTVINDILDLSKVRAGMMKLTSQRFSVRAMMEDANETLGTLAFSKGIELNYTVDIDVPDIVFGDNMRMRQVALNVIGNAIKFTNVGEVFTRCSVEKIDYSTNTVVLKWECIDTGQGFNRDDQLQMFKPFSQVESSTLPRHGGSGLGLVISKELVELHNGSMSCQSRRGVGTRFMWTATFTMDKTPLKFEPPDGCCPVCFCPYEKSKQSTEDYYCADDGNDKSATNFVKLAVNKADPGRESNRRKLESDKNVQSNKYVNPFASESEFCRCGASADPYTVLFWRLYRNKPSGIKLDKSALAVVVSHTKYSSEAIGNMLQSIIDISSFKDIVRYGNTYEAFEELLENPMQSKVTHIILNLPDIEAYVLFVKSLQLCSLYKDTKFILVTSTRQKESLSKIFSDSEDCNSESIHYVLKLVKPSKFFPLFYSDSEEKGKIGALNDMTRKAAMEQKADAETLRYNLAKSGFSVLLAEDNIINIKVISRYLERIGVKFKVTMDGLQCVEEWKREKPNFYSLILMDLQMPVMDGYQACNEIRKYELENDYPKVPIVALSANALPHVVLSCKDSGFDSYLAKPITLQHLSLIISGILNYTNQSKLHK
ncbi:phosphorelay sensor kinase Mak1 [Schizosaccharomyces pombe]|uniref:Peroxide stress-activated histidine kinase mak1 n=1 Tax=Schizosaccharomyces pombe (strain 972 / ATCC 24843) TaxID=284812 RepID=MAK1_SCHPO|nr:histidine kinase Mak1 [Schizosaccharomyces pombe]Q9P7Q7.1 RecName: Full=Peroxide stress-activated histidine kinase mak1; AltName: Full=His-Asp phosphorelay kinase phk3; AltName: Full=Mcs4-associated kinase 1 [Schizosaccharomyces pombe 972h-]CAB75776.1 histidine kinase Mak1 [Schizosaccharomyces pombe]|eukprot:NP_594687.1 histidine kinase Mak1 [Schizosaccharomyces pombe]